MRLCAELKLREKMAGEAGIEPALTRFWRHRSTDELHPRIGTDVMTDIPSTNVYFPGILSKRFR